MLENMRKQGASVFLYLVFGLLIAIFIVNINPGSNQQGGCSTGGSALLTVDGNKVGKSAYMVAYSNQFIPTFMRMWNFKTQKEREYAAVELLIRRELLAQAAAERGLRVTDEMVMEEIKKGYFFVGGERIALGDRIFDMHEDGSKTWNVNKFKNWVGSLNVSKNAYLEEQARGMQAAMMRELLVGSVRVSKDEAKDAYVHQKTTVSYDVVAFQPRDYAKAMKLTDADIQRYLKDHEEEVKAKFKADERKYKDVKPSLKLRKIFIAKAEDEKTDKKPEAPGGGSGSAGSGSAAVGSGSATGSGSAVATGSGSAAKKDDKKPDATAKKDDKKDDKKPDAKKKVGMSIDEAKTKLEAARAAVAANKRKFADLASELSTDEVMKATGGDPRWHTAENAQLGDKALNDQVKALKPGEMTSPVVTDKGVWLILVEDKRPVGDAKDLTYDQVKMEIAAELAKDAWSKEAAKRAAIKALGEAKGKNLGDLYQESFDDQIRRKVEADRLKGQPGMPDMPMPDMPDLELPDQPMAWKPGDDATGGSSGGSGSAKPNTGSANTGSANAGSANAGSANTGSAGAGAGSGAPAPAPTPAPTVPAPKVIEPTKEDLPNFSDIAKPNLKRYTNLNRLPQLPGLGKELVPVLFDVMVEGTLADRIYESDGAYVLVQVTAKGKPDMNEFDKAAAGEMAKLRLFRSGYLVEDWLKSKCEQLAKDEKIRVPADLMEPEKPELGPDGKPLPTPPKPTYRLCMTFHRM